MAPGDDVRSLVELLVAAQPSWMADALCKEYQEVPFFAELGQSTVEAKNVCARCLVKSECLSYALADETLTGVWGGTGPKERHRLRRHQRAA